MKYSMPVHQKPFYTISRGDEHAKKISITVNAYGDPVALIEWTSDIVKAIPFGTVEKASDTAEFLAQHHRVPLGIQEHEPLPQI